LDHANPREGAVECDLGTVRRGDRVEVVAEVPCSGQLVDAGSVNVDGGDSPSALDEDDPSSSGRA
jgi:hypothetical protein